MQGLHWYSWYKIVIQWLSICVGDTPLAKARGLWQNHGETIVCDCATCKTLQRSHLQIHRIWNLNILFFFFEFVASWNMYIHLKDEINYSRIFTTLSAGCFTLIICVFVLLCSSWVSLRPVIEAFTGHTHCWDNHIYMYRLWSNNDRIFFVSFEMILWDWNTL